MKSSCAYTLSLFIVGIGLAVSGYSQSSVTRGLVAFFPFNGDASDASGNGHDGMVTGATLTTDRFGQPNGAYLFTGTNAYITVPFNSTVFSNDFTVSLWFQVQDFQNNYLQLLHQEGQSFVLQIPTNSRILVAYSARITNTFSWKLDGPQPTPIGTNIQVVITKAGTNATMYLNSQVVATTEVFSPNPRAGTNLYIGRALNDEFGGAMNTVFHGVIDDVRIYNRALSPYEVGRLYAIEAGLPFETEPLVNVHKAVWLDSYSLSIGTNYQLQVSSDFNTWTNHGAVFTATNSTWRSTNYWDVDNWNSLYFRLIPVP